MFSFKMASIKQDAEMKERKMLGILAQSLMIATRLEPRNSRERLAEQRRLEDEYFWQGRITHPQCWFGR